MEWVTRIYRALEENQLQLFAQSINPMVKAPGKQLHYELLIRMQSDEGGIIPPGSFLPAAERYNLIAMLDRWVINNSFCLLMKHGAFLSNIGLCSINLSGQSLTEDGFLDFIINRFDETGMRAEKICFEITETAAIANLSKASNFITTLRSIGCSFALDDFGSGLSSFGYLKNLPVDYLKIDGMFVKDMVNNPIDRAMVKSINEIGQVMGMETIAEFVENEETIALLGTIGVDYVQGYAFGRPAPLLDILNGA
ncbi:MAG: EAL domain-containing protein, partial [bacterium]|nr:EAL domain-containing protein [bacterium]